MIEFTDGHLRMCYTVARRMVADAGDVDDAAQEAALKLWRLLGLQPRANEAVQATACMRGVQNAQARRRRQWRGSVPLLEIDDTDPLLALDPWPTVDAALMVGGVLATVPDTTERQYLRLRFLHNWRIAEAAASVGVTQQWMNRRWRAGTRDQLAARVGR